MTRAVRPCRRRAQTLLHQQLGEGVDVGGGLVQDQDARVGQQRAGEGDELALAHAEVAAALADGRVVAVRAGA